MIGLGYIGLPTATLFGLAQEKGHRRRYQPSTPSTRSTRAGSTSSSPNSTCSCVRGHRRLACAQPPSRSRPTPSSSPCRRRSTTATSPTSAISKPPPAPSLRCWPRATSSSSNPPRPVGTTEQLAAGWRRAPRPQLPATRSRQRRHRRSPTAPSACCPGSVRELVENDRVIGGMTSAAAPSGPRALQDLRAGRAWSPPTPAPPRCASSPRTPSATSTSPSPTSCRSSATSSTSTSGN
jgi:hypothetical protein